ncbi:hypothetical protein BGZ54_004748, partial [Gamsiella multidivaricata]
MQSDAFKRFGKDLQDALVIPVNYINKKTKKITTLNEKRKSMGLSGLTISSPHIKSQQFCETWMSKHDADAGLYTPWSDSISDSMSLNNFSLSTLSKTSCDDNPSLTSSNGSV